MGTETTNPPAPPPADPDPYFYGWRMVPRWKEDGTQGWEKVPLTEWDVLHPQEDDFIMQNPAHDRDVHYLKDALGDVLVGESGVLVLADTRIDWQIPNLGAHCPDIAVFQGVRDDWDPHRATFSVRDEGAKPVLVVEVTSPSTRYIDLDEKVVHYHRAGVPVYVITDHREQDGRAFVSLLGFRTTPDGYVRMSGDEEKGLWIEPLRVWFKPDGDRVACLTADGQRIPDWDELRLREREATHRAETAAVERDAEKARADEQKARADAEAARADETARKLAELEAELKRLRGNTDTPNS